MKPSGDEVSSQGHDPCPCSGSECLGCDNSTPPPRHSLHCSVANMRAENHSRLRAVCSEPMLTAILDYMSVMGLAVLRVLNSLYLVREAGQDKLEIPELWNSQRFKGR